MWNLIPSVFMDAWKKKYSQKHANIDETFKGKFLVRALISVKEKRT